jgi:hypothetical protein
MGYERKAKPSVLRRANAPKIDAPRPMAIFALQSLAGNQAVKRMLEGKIPSFVFGGSPARHPIGVRHMQALPRIRPEDLKGVLQLQLPPELDLSTLQVPSKQDNEFIVAGGPFGVTIVHPASDTRIRVVEEEHRYKPEEWTYETQKYPKETPSISYQLIAPEEDKPGEILIAVGPGAFIEVEEPAPFEGAKEWQLENWQPRLSGNFVVTVVEMPDNFLVPLPNEDIDVATLLKAGGKMRYPDKHIWRGAISYQDYVVTMGMLIAQILFAAAPFAVELAMSLSELAALASEAAALAPEMEELAAISGLEAEGAPVAEAPLEEVGPELTSGETLPSVEETPVEGAPEHPPPRDWRDFLSEAQRRSEAVATKYPGGRFLEAMDRPPHEIIERLAAKGTLTQAEMRTFIQALMREHPILDQLVQAQQLTGVAQRNEILDILHGFFRETNIGYEVVPDGVVQNATQPGNFASLRSSPGTLQIEASAFNSTDQLASEVTHELSFHYSRIGGRVPALQETYNALDILELTIRNGGQYPL